VQVSERSNESAKEQHIEVEDFVTAVLMAFGEQSYRPGEDLRQDVEALG
jgi:hypothetical protein